MTSGVEIVLEIQYLWEQEKLICVGNNIVTWLYMSSLEDNWK